MNYSEMTIAQLLAVHNEMAERLGANDLKSWKKAKSGLIDIIEAMAEQIAETEAPA